MKSKSHLETLICVPVRYASYRPKNHELTSKEHHGELMIRKTTSLEYRVRKESFIDKQSAYQFLYLFVADGKNSFMNDPTRCQ